MEMGLYIANRVFIMWLDYQINSLSYSQLSVLKEECLVAAESDREV